jgi:HSP20 family protein
MRREFDRVFDRFGHDGFDLAPFGNGRLLPEADYAETDKDIVITAELPGVDAADVEISLAHNVLTIRGEKRSERNEKKEQYQFAERAYGAFERVIGVPEGIDPAKVEAKFDKGVLKVTLPKPPEAKRQKIDIKAGA